MATVDEQSLEFQALDDDEQLTAISRSTFRIPVGDVEGNSLVIAGSSYRLLDISASGVRVSSEEKPYLGEVVNDCELHIGDYTFSKLSGRVVYSSPETEQVWSFGIQWFDNNDDTVQRMADALKALRRDMFQQQSLPDAPQE